MPPILRLTPAIRALLIINVAFFALSYLFTQINFTDLFALHHPSGSKFRFWQPITHIFMHGSFMHIFFNMIGLIMFGSSLEDRWGSRKFVIYFLVSAVGGASLYLLINDIEMNQLQKLIHAFTAQPDIENFKHFIKKEPLFGTMIPLEEIQEKWNYSKEGSSQLMISLVNQYYEYVLNVPCVGASGGVYGILLAYGIIFPNVMILLFFIPVPARLAVFILAGIAIYNGLANDPTDHVAHFAHLGGMLFGFIVLHIWKEINFDRFRLR